MKKHLKIHNFILLLTLIMIISSCKFQNIEIGEIKNVSVDKISNERIIINLPVFIKNPNNFKIKLKSYDLDIKINGHKFNILESDNKVVIPKKFEGFITIPLVIDSEGMLSFNTIKTVLKIIKQKQFELDAKGHIKVSVFPLSKKIEINEKRKIKLTRNK